jgi:hypothetical protein
MNTNEGLVDEKNELQVEQIEQVEIGKEPLNKKGFIKKIGLPVAIIILALIAILLNPKKSTQPQNPLIAKVQNQPIYLSDIKNVASEQYEPYAINNNTLHRAYETLIERAILNKETQKLAIIATDKEIEDRLKTFGITGGPVPRAFKLAAKYDILKEKLVKKTVKSTEAYSIGFYIASYDEQKGNDVTAAERKMYDQQRADGKLALSQIETRLRRGDTPVTVAHAIFNAYPSLRPILAVNGYILQSAPPEITLDNPKLYTYDESVATQPLFSAIYTMQPGQIRVVEEQNGSGGNVIFVKSVNRVGAENYDTWLEAKKKELVKTYNNTI